MLEPAFVGSDFEEFYRAGRDRIYRALALTLRDVDLAVEAADEGFTRAFERWARVRRYENPGDWVYRVGLNWALSRLRRRTRETASRVPHPATVVVDPPDPELLKAVAGLSVKLRAVVVLRIWADWSTADVARALRVPPGTVKSRLSRALARLAQDLEEDR